MLSDPLPVRIAVGNNNGTTLIDFTQSFGVTDVAPGSVTRTSVFSTTVTGWGKQTMKVSHTETKENIGLITDRTLIRFDTVITNTAGVQSVVSAYAVIAVPRMPLMDTDLLGKLAAATLGNFLQNGGSTDTPGSNHTLPYVENGQRRLLLGEG
jgi:hypothetical protein